MNEITITYLRRRCRSTEIEQPTLRRPILHPHHQIDAQLNKQHQAAGYEQCVCLMPSRNRI